ncbi:MAG: propanediol utilization protein [Pseudomonadota bacterium]
MALLTVPFPAFGVRAVWAPAGPFRLAQPRRLIARGQAAALFRAAGWRHPFGHLRLTSTMPPGGGGGASTAAIVATARLLGLAAPRLPDLAVAIERASDPSMLADPGAWLWAPRRARAVRQMARPAPMRLVGGFVGPPRWTDPGDGAFDDISDLVTCWDGAETAADFAALAQASATRRLGRLGEDPAPWADAVRQSGALGFIIAHSGSARGLLLALDAGPPAILAARRALQARGARGCVTGRVGGAA